MDTKIHIAVREGGLDPAPAFAFVSDPSCGAVASFVGIVRDRHDGRPVSGMSYDAHPALAEQALIDICHEAMNFWDGVNLYVEHATGELAVGDASVVIAAASPHRAQAFEACRFIIEEIKKRAPIWKREHYADGSDAWLPGTRIEQARPKGSCGCGGCGCGGS